MNDWMTMDELCDRREQLGMKVDELRVELEERGGHWLTKMALTRAEERLRAVQARIAQLAD